MDDLKLACNRFLNDLQTLAQGKGRVTHPNLFQVLDAEARKRGFRLETCGQRLDLTSFTFTA